MYRDHTIGVVVPAYNEERFVGEVVETVPSYVDRIYVVDDGSTDGTWAEILTAADRVNDRHEGDGPFDRRVVPIQHEENRGVGGAIKTGYLMARDDAIDVTAVMGGDGQMRPGHLETVIEPVVAGRADYVKGNRLLDADHRDGMPRFRYVGNVLLSWLTRIASGYWSISDPQNGYTAISLKALRTVDVEDMYEFYGYCNDLLVKCNVEGLRVVDVPRTANYADEESHITYSTYIPRVSLLLLRNFCWRIWTKYVARDRHPIGALLAVGLLGTLGGLGGLVASTVVGTDPGPISPFALVTGLVALVGGFWWDAAHAAHLDWREWGIEGTETEDHAEDRGRPISADAGTGPDD